MKRSASWLVALVLVAVASAWLSAQVVARKVNPPVTVNSGDIRFIVEGYRGSVALGHWEVRLGGEWVEAEKPVGPELYTPPKG